MRAASRLKMGALLLTAGAGLAAYGAGTYLQLRDSLGHGLRRAASELFGNTGFSDPEIQSFIFICTGAVIFTCGLLLILTRNRVKR